MSNSKRFTLRINPEMYRMLTLASKKIGVNMSDLARIFIYDGLRDSMYDDVRKIAASNSLKQSVANKPKDA